MQAEMICEQLKLSDYVSFTPIGWIGRTKRAGDEWNCFSKKFVLDEKPKFAAVRMDSYGVCGIYVNGEFLEGGSGRFPSRITYAECTSLLHEGENHIMLKLGNHFYQSAGVEIRKRREAWFSAVAAELVVRGEHGQTVVVTDESWSCISDEGESNAERFSDVNQMDYDRFWKAAALYREPKEVEIPDAIIKTVGNEYADYARSPRDIYREPERIVETNMKPGRDGCLSAERDGALKERPFAICDFGRLQVGYVELTYEAEADGNVELDFDYTESPEDFDQETSNAWGTIKRLRIKERIERGTHTLQLIHRRACRFLKLCFSQECGCVRIRNVRFRISMLPSEQTGWFHCPDEELNRIWEVGKYTLYINKHQEYESCPRNEMKFFTGDGIIDALIDYYAFGDSQLVDASLALTEIDCNSGLVPNVYARNFPLWDYPAWRIVMIYDYYRYFGDLELVRRYYEELVLNLQWMIQRMNKNGLIYQFPLFCGPFYVENDAVEYNCSFDRLGEKPYLNALLYKVLICMGELAKALDDERGEGWLRLASDVRTAINHRLWDEEAGAYRDLYDTSYIPQDGNALAVTYGVADPARAKRILSTLKAENWSSCGSAILSEEKPMGGYGGTHTRGGRKTISPAMCMHEAEGRFLQQDEKGALELIHNCWGTMLRKGATSFWEFAPNDPDKGWDVRAHAWAGGCTYLIGAYVLGIRPGKPGYESLLFAPCQSMDAFRGVVPTVKGLVAVSCETIDGKRNYTLCVPRGMEVEAALPSGAQLNMVDYELDS